MNNPAYSPHHAVEVDSNIERQDRSMPRASGDTLFSRLENIASLSQIIRVFGACAILASMSLFMLQGWSDGNDITRYLKLLAQTGLLTGAGLALSFLIKEFKGARVFFGLALVSVVANFTILGSLTYSMFPLDSQLVDYPEMMKWEVINGAIFLPVFLGAVALLSVVSFFGFSIFSRHISKSLTLGFLGLCSLLLIPVRGSLLATGLAAIALWGAWMLIQRLRQNDKVVFTKETKVSLALLVLPGLIIIARALSFYVIDEMTLLAVSALLFVALRSISSMIDTQNLASRMNDVVQFALGIFMAVMVVEILPLATSVYNAFIATIIVISFSYEKLLNGKDDAWKAWMTNFTTLVIVPLVLVSAVIGSELIYSLQTLIITGLLFALNLTANKALGKALLGQTISIIALVIATLIVLFDLVQLAQLGNWMIIGLAGGTLIVGASIYERYGLKLIGK